MEGSGIPTGHISLKLDPQEQVTVQEALQLQAYAWQGAGQLAQETGTQQPITINGQPPGVAAQRLFGVLQRFDQQT